MIDTTVIIPNFNGIKYIEDCLRSLCECEMDVGAAAAVKQGGQDAGAAAAVVQGGQDAEAAAAVGQSGQDAENEATAGQESCQLQFPVIVVDNGSQDGSAELVEERFPAVRLIRFAENRGFCHAVNTGILAARTRYVILLNNDTVVEKRFVSRLTETLEKNDRYFSAGAKMVSLRQPDIIDDAGDFYCALGWAFARGKGKRQSRYDRPCNVFAACGGAAIYRTDVLKRLGMFDEAHFAYLEDMDIAYRARIYGYVNRFEPDAMVRHAGSASSGSRYNEFKVRLSSRNSVYLIWKNMPLLQILLNMPFLLLGFFVKTLFFMKKGYGKLYIEGLANGLRLSLSAEGRARKVRFRPGALPAYIRIEAELLYNMLRYVFLC